MRLLRALIPSILIGLALNCGSQGPQTLRIAVACPLTGDDTAIGQGMFRGVSLAVKDANAAKLLGDRVLEVAAFDDRSDPKEAVTVANQIVSDKKIFAVIGHYNSGCSIPASQVYNKHQLVMITPASTNPKLTRQGFKTVFRVCGTDDVQGYFAANYVLDTLKLNRVAVIHDKTAYGQGVAEEFQKQFLARGGNLLSFDGIDRGDKDFKALLTRIKESNPELLYYGGMYVEAGMVSKQAKELGLTVPLFGTDGVYSNEFLRIGGSGTEGDFATMTGLPPEHLPKAGDFMKAYRENYPGEDIQPFDPMAYEGAMVAIKALAAANLDRTRMAGVISSTTHDGILGETSFDEHGDSRNKLISVVRVTDGRFEFYAHQ